MSEAWPVIKIREFEYAVIAPGKSIVRVNGQGPRRHEPGHRPALVIDDGIKEQRFSPQSAPPDRGRTLRAAYAVPLAMVKNARAFWLEHESGERTNLPVPEAGSARRERGAETETPSDRELPDGYDEARRLEQRIVELEEVHARDLRAALSKAAEAQARVASAEERAASAEHRERLALDQQAAVAGQNDALSRQVAELEQSTQALRTGLTSAERELAQATSTLEPMERELTELRATRKSLEREFDHARDQLRVMTGERDELSRQASAFDNIAVKARERAAQAESAHQKSSAALQELELWREELERRLAATTTELGDARAAREADERELERLRQAISDAENLYAGSSENDHGVRVDSSETLAAQAAEIERLAAELASLRARGASGD